MTTVAGPVIIEICGQGPRHRPLPPLCGGGPPRLLSSALGREEAIIEF